MKLTIDIKEFCKSEANAYKEGLSEKDFKSIVGEAVCRSAAKLLEFRDENESIPIDGAICSEIASTVATKTANRSNA